MDDMMAGDGWNVMPIFYHILPLLDGFFFFFESTIYYSARGGRPR